MIVPEDKVKFQALCANLQATMAVVIRNMPVAGRKFKNMGQLDCQATRLFISQRCLMVIL
jgi:hypothetical protein